jgi:transglutaminase-like putative cysteine protease
VTRLTAPDAAIATSAGPFRRLGDTGRLADELAAFVRQRFSYAHDETTVRTTAAQAWAGRVGVCQDMAHVLISMCASLDVPARYVSGHMVGDGASHAWVEVFDASTGRAIAVDPTHARRTDLRYITTAVGRDYRDVAPTTGTYDSEGGSGRLTVHKKIRLAELL